MLNASEARSIAMGNGYNQLLETLIISVSNCIKSAAENGKRSVEFELMKYQDVKQLKEDIGKCLYDNGYSFSIFYNNRHTIMAINW